MKISGAWTGVQEALGEVRAIVEQRVPAGVVRAVNDTAFGVRAAWQREAVSVFDRPTAFTRNAVLVAKAGSSFSARGAEFRGGRGATEVEARIYLRDDALKGTPPVKYLFPQVQGGLRTAKRFEQALRHAGILPAGMFVVAASGAKLDRYGNIRGTDYSRILRHLRSSSDAHQNITNSRRSRAARSRSAFFAIRPRIDRSHLKPGVYERRGSTGADIVPWLVFVDRVSYRKRYDVFDVGQRFIDANLPARLAAELAKEGV